jgi:hypothetical protein
VSESLLAILRRTHSALMVFAVKCGEDAEKAPDPLFRAALEGLGGQITDRAAQVESWIFRTRHGVTAEEEARMRDGCAEFLRMVRKD